MNRRGFLGAMLAAGVSPAIVRAANIMPVFVRREVAGLLIPETVSAGNTLITIEQITREALAILGPHLQLARFVREQYDRENAMFMIAGR